MRARKKPVEVECIRYDPPNNCHEVWDFCGWDWKDHDPSDCGRHAEVLLETYNGFVPAHPGDYIIRGVEGELYPCDADIFAKTYEVVEE